MLLNVVTALSLAATPATPQTFFGATEGAGPGGPVTTSAYVVTGLGLGGTPTLPVREEAVDAVLELNQTDTLTLSIADVGYGSTDTTYTFSGTNEGFTETGLSAALSLTYVGVNGNPGGAIRSNLAQFTGGLTENEEFARQLAWTDLGVPGGKAVAYLEVVSLDANMPLVAFVTGNELRVRFRQAGSGISANPFTATLPLTVESAFTTYTGNGWKAVDAAAQPAESVVDLVVGHDVTRSIMDGRLTAYFDNLTVRPYWTEATLTANAETITELGLGATARPVQDLTGRTATTDQEFNRADTLTLSVTEDPVSEFSWATFDTLSLTLPDTRTLYGTLDRTDTLTLRLPTETWAINPVGGTVVPVSAADTLSLAITETETFFDTVDTTDTLSITVTEGSPATLVELTTEYKSGTDTLSLTLASETWDYEIVEPFVTLEASDALSLTVTETARSQNTTQIGSITFRPRQKRMEIWTVNVTRSP